MLSSFKEKIILFVILFSLLMPAQGDLPIVVNTWPWPQATDAAWNSLLSSTSPLDAVERGCTQCEIDQCDGSVGYGNHPDENGETTLDAMIMNGTTMNVGSVGCLRSVRNAIGVARKVLDNTEHTLLVGQLATDFAIQMGFEKQSLETEASHQEWKAWKTNNCQPNYYTNVTPDPKTNCGPFSPSQTATATRKSVVNESNHDTIGMVAINANRNVAAGTSTNGLNHKIPGRVGDSPIVGSGAYADDEVGAAVATGDGDVMMRFLPSYQIVESMRNGATPTEAAQDAIKRILKRYPHFSGAVIGVSIDGIVGAACTGFPVFHYCVRNSANEKTVIVPVNCM